MLLAPTPRTPASNSPRFKSLPARVKAVDETVRATILPKSKTSFSTDTTPTKILCEVRASPLDSLTKLAKAASLFTEENPLIPTLKRHIFRLNAEEDLRKLALFLAQYLKVCEMGEILKFQGEISSISEKCHSKMEHVPFETRLKIRFKEFYALEFIRLFKSSLERNLVIYEKYCHSYQWFTEFQFIAHFLKEEISSIDPSNYPYVLKFLIKLAIYSDINNATFKKYFDPVFRLTLKCHEIGFEEEVSKFSEILKDYTIEDIRRKRLPEKVVHFLELAPLNRRNFSEFISWEEALKCPPVKRDIPPPLNWSQILIEVKKHGSNEEIARKIAEDLKTLSINSIKEVSLSHFCHLKRGHNWVAKLINDWNALNNLVQRTLDQSSKKKGAPNRSIAKFMVEIAYKCFEAHDLQSASALTLGLKDYKKLPKLSKSTQKKLSDLIEKFTLVHQYESLRKEIVELEKQNILYVPYLPLLNKEISMIDTGNPDTIGRQINEDKIKLLTRTFEKFLEHQSKFTKKKSVYTDILFELNNSTEK